MALMTKMVIPLIILGWLTVPGSAQCQPAADVKGELLHVDGQEDAGRFKVLIKVKGPVRYKSSALTGPHRLVIDLSPCSKGGGIPDMNQGPVRRLRSSQFNEDTVRIVLDLDQPVPYSLAAQSGDPFLLTVTFTRAAGNNPAAERKNPNPKTKKALSAEKTGKSGKEPHPAVERAEVKKTSAISRTGENSAVEIPGETAELVLQRSLAGQIGMAFEKGHYREVLRLAGRHRELLKESADPGLLQQVGNSYRALGFYGGAVRSFQAAWQGGAQGAPGLVLDWAESLAGQDKFAEAASLVQDLLERPNAMRDQQGRAVRLLVRCLYRQRLYPEALKTLEEAGRPHSRWFQDPENQYWLGLAGSEIPGCGPKALAAFRQFVVSGQDPGRTALAYEKMGDLYFADQRYEEAWRAYYQACRLQPPAPGTFAAKKLTQCRLLVEGRRGGPAPGNGADEPDPFWKKLYEHRSAQQKLEKNLSELRLK
jgi:tetratricopeptide (TPR) repeat protein